MPIMGGSIRAISDTVNAYSEICLAEYSNIIHDSSKKAYEKYLYLSRIVEINDKKMALLFGDKTSRSKAFLQLLAIRGEGLANEELVSQLSREFQERTHPESVKW